MTYYPKKKQAMKKAARKVRMPISASEVGLDTAAAGQTDPAPGFANGGRWIAGAVKHPGAFKAKAQAAGETTAQYATEKASAPGKLGEQARLAKTLMGMGKK